MALTLDEFRDRNLLDEIADIFESGENARLLLERFGFPRGRIPENTPNANAFWLSICREIARGITPRNLDDLLEIIADMYPGNSLFAPWNKNNRASSDEQQARRHEKEVSGSTSVTIGQVEDGRDLSQLAHQLAQEMELGPVVPAYSVNGELCINLESASQEQTRAFARALIDRLRAQGGNHTVEANNHRDYLLSRLLIEGPDQGRFEVCNIPASTRTGDLGSAVLEEYEENVWPKDREGKPRPLTMDRIKDDGSRERLPPDKTLHENEVQDGETLHMAPESTAGAVNPIIQQEALARVRAQVLRFSTAHPGFTVSANARHAPTEYTFTFQAPGWAPPREPGGQPQPIDEHRVFLQLPPAFPMVAPACFWKSPIFHPNVATKNGKVCLGILEEHYRPGMDMGELCQMLIDLARWRNYEVREYYNLEARNWALTPEGNIAIEQRGGDSQIRKFLHQVVPPRRRLRVKKIDTWEDRYE